MKLKNTTLIVRLVLVGLFAALTLSLSAGATSVSASSERSGRLHLEKECSQNSGLPGGFCTFTYSNLRQIPAFLSKVFYDQAGDIPAGLLDSNVVLDAGQGNRAMGRCTLDFSTGRGLCTFSDGTGELSGFEARVKVNCPGATCTWDGTYSFNREHDRDR